MFKIIEFTNKFSNFIEHFRTQDYESCRLVH